MHSIIIRNLDPVVIAKIDRLAKQKNMSREEYLRRYLSRLAALEEVEQTEEKYANLVSALADRLEQSNDIIEANTLMLEKTMERLKADN